MAQPHGTGIYHEAAPTVDRIPPYDPRAGAHFWILLVAYRVDPTMWDPTQQVHLDAENLAQVAAPGCYYCERAYTPRVAARRSRGDLRSAS